MRAYERLINYTKFATASEELSNTHPSTPEQLVFGKALVEEMKSLGIMDAAMDENGYVFGTIEANIENWSGPVLGFIAHMDVVSSVPFSDIHTHIIENYDGSEIILNAEQNVKINPAEFDFMKNYIGQDLLVTNGNTLLGADDKAGIAEILTMAETLYQHPEIKHGTIKIGFTPDEEIGKGADLFDVKRFGADFAYTVDGAAYHEVEYETFNAAAADIVLQGVSIHTGDAKDKLVNASLLAMEFHALLPERERPEYTEQYEGFYHLDRLEGTVDKAKMHYLLRDHDLNKLNDKKAIINAVATKLNEKYGQNTVRIETKDSYYNMAEQIKPHWHLIESAYEAIRELGGTPISRPVRGGTDGSRLSFMGLPCPNLGTGSHNHHGKTEFACLQAMDQCVELLIKLVVKYANS
ncbi:MAG: pepT [Herbinix sp.]|jgi:tripeptide aminopeptidase|nr:pepT [Herbinix sp.]